LSLLFPVPDNNIRLPAMRRKTYFLLFWGSFN